MDYRILLFWYTEGMNPLNHFETILTVNPQVELHQQFETDRQLSHLLNPQMLIIRAWPTSGIILGKLDTVLPGFEDGLNYLQHQDLPVMIRKAGGLGVVCDEEVLNLTFLLSKHHPIYGGLHASYTLAVELIRGFLNGYGVELEAKMIPQSYCPGDYDLSVNGKKMAGLAQFRSKDAVMVMATLAIGGNQTQRCERMRGFYQRANRNQDPTYPDIDPQVMTTLNEIIGQNLNVDDVWEQITTTVSSRE